MNNIEKPKLLYRSNNEMSGGGKTAEQISREGIEVVERFIKNSAVEGATYFSKVIGGHVHVIKSDIWGEENHVDLGPKPKD